MITSSIGYTHTVTLEPVGAGYRVAKDAFRGIGWDSPDVQTTSRAETPSPGGRVPGLASHGVAPAGTVGTYYRYTASNYATIYWHNYNPAYYNYNPVGGDCTSFVSQSLFAGSQTLGTQSDSAGWWYNGSAAYPYSGTAWRYSVSHESWLINHGRGYNVGAATSLDAGDPIYYDWYPADGATDHTVIVVGWGGGNTPVVSMHNPDLNAVYWNNWMASWLKPYTAHFLRMYDTFTY